MQEVKLQFHSVLQGDHPIEDGYYFVACISPLNTDDVTLLKLWWDSESRTWFSSEKKNGNNGEGYTPSWYYGDWWCKPCKIGLESKYSTR